MGNAEFAEYATRLRVFMARGEEDEAAFNRLALELFALQFEHVTIYREFCASRKAKPGSIARWRDIPTLPTETFKEFEATSLDRDERKAVFYSSGTTAEDRSRHFHSTESLALYEDSLRPWFQRHFRPGEAEMSLVLLTPSRTEAPNSSLAHMFDMVAKSFPWAAVETVGRVSAEGWEVDAEQATRVLCEAKKPVALLGTAFRFVHLLDANAKERLRLPRGSRVLETGGYKGRSRALPKNELHELIRERLGIDLTHIVSEYGMSELSSQAYDKVAGSSGGVFHFPPWARIDVVSPDTGQTVTEGECGLLRVYDLANARSVFALQTADLAVRRGTGFELLGRVEAATLRGCSLMSA